MQSLPTYSLGTDPDIARNFQLAQLQSWQNNPVNRKANEFDVPVLLWQDEYETNSKKFIDQVLRRVSDTMLLNPHPLFEYNNPNQAYLSEVAAGKLRQQDYIWADTLLGDYSGTPTKDNHFFEVPKATLNGQILSQPLQFGCKLADEAFAQKKIIEDSRGAAKQASQMMIEAGIRQGLNLGFATDNRVSLPKDPNDLLTYMTGQQQVESTMYKILKHIDYEQGYQNLSAETNDNAFDVNARFGMIDVLRDELYLKSLHYEQVRWLANKRVKTLEDPAVFGVQVNEYMTVTELMNQFGMRINTGTGIRGLMNFFDAIMKGRNVGYDPKGNYWNEYGISGWGIGSGINNLNDDRLVYTPRQINWMRQLFYPIRRWASGLTMSVLVQRNYVQLMRMKRYRIERRENGVIRPATDREFTKWRDDDFEREIDIVITAVGKKEDVRGQHIRDMISPELIEFTRVGHDTFFDVGLYKYQQDGGGNPKQFRKNLPVFAQISYDKSFAKRGENTIWRVNVLYQRVDELMQQIGLPEALLIDDAQGEEPLTYLYNARKTGLIRYDSSKMQPSNQAQLQHLTTRSLGNHMAEIQLILTELRQLTQEYQTSIGLGPQVSGQGVDDKYVGIRKTQLNIANQQLLITKFLLDNTKFINQALQRSSDIGRVVYARQGYKIIMFNKGEQELLALTQDFPAAGFGIYVESGLDIQNKINSVRQLVANMASSGGADQMEAVFEVNDTDNPAEAVAILKRLNTRIRDEAKQQQEISQQQFQQQQTAKQEENNKLYALEYKKLDLEREKLVLTMGGQQAKDDRKGQMKDIDAVRAREEQIVQAHLDNEAQQMQAEQQAALQQQQQQPQPAQ